MVMGRPTLEAERLRDAREDAAAFRSEASYLAVRLTRLGQMLEFRAHDHGDMRTLPMAAELKELGRSVQRRWVGEAA